MNIPCDNPDRKQPADVLLLPSWYLPLGGEFCREQAWHLNRSGLVADVLATISLPWKKYPVKLLTESWRDKVFDDDGIFTYSRIHRPVPRQDERNMERWVHATLALFERYISFKGMPRLIHAHSSTWAGYAASRISRQHGIPYLLTEHRGIFGLRSKLAEESFKPYYTPYLQDAFGNASHILAVSEQQLPKIRTFLRNEVPLEVLSNMVDTDFFACRGRKCTEGPFRFISVNSFRDVKGYDILLPAFDRVCRKFPDTELVIAGDGFEHPDFVADMQKISHRDSIRFAGLLDREGVRNALCEADALVISSRVEAQSISVLEALSIGLPIVCTEPIPEYVVGATEGIRVPVEDVGALAAAMCRMVCTAGTYDPMTLSEHVRMIASPAHVTRRLIEVYTSIVPDLVSQKR